MSEAESWISCSGLSRLLQQPGAHPAVLRAQVQSSTEATTKTGKPYRQLSLTDGNANLLLRIWQDAPSYSRVSQLEGGEFLALKGRWEDKGYGPDATELRLRELEPNEIEELLVGDPEIQAKQAHAWQTINDLIASINQPQLKAIAELFLQEHGPAFRRAAAAANFHHARRGGLIEHVSGMLRATDALSRVYPELNRDLLLTGVLFHDSGKLWENPLPERGFSQTPQLEGEALGHIVLGIQLVNQLWQQLADQRHPAWAAPTDNDTATAEHLRLHLLHLIASHHGEHEWGSPVLPKTPEAIALHYIDNIDAKLEMLAQGYRAAEVSPGIFPPVRPLRQRLLKPWQPSNTSATDSQSESSNATPFDQDAPNHPTSPAPQVALHNPAARPSLSRSGTAPTDSERQQPTEALADPLDQIPWEKDDLF